MQGILGTGIGVLPGKFREDFRGKDIRHVFCNMMTMILNTHTLIQHMVVVYLLNVKALHEFTSIHQWKTQPRPCIRGVCIMTGKIGSKHKVSKINIQL